MDIFGITYIVENAQQFWSELDDMVQLPVDASLLQLDATLRHFILFCATYHEQYLQTPIQLDHACNLLLESELFAFHSGRMSEILLEDAETTTDPHSQLILYKVLLMYGRAHPSFLRSQKKWQPLIPLLMDHVLLDFDPELEDNYAGSVSGAGWSRQAVVVPIEARLRLLAVGILYEVCRVQKFSLPDLKIFANSFIEHLFELVEQTRHMQDETLNYSVIKLIVSLNEQFMVASIPNAGKQNLHHSYIKPNIPAEEQNRVLRILMHRLGSSKTFGENMIFMLNRAGRSEEDLCMQLLILKILYLLFTTTGTSDFFYTNDLCVLVDVFLRELVDLDEESESLRHTYLRVMHPLLTRTQLRNVPYKRPQIVRTLESLVSNPSIREVTPTTKRLVERCLGGEWCVQLRRVDALRESGLNSGASSPVSDSILSSVRGVVAASATVEPSTSADALPQTQVKRTGSKTLKSSKSVENLRKSSKLRVQQINRDNLHAASGRPTNDSSLSLTSLAVTLPTSPSSPAKISSSSQPRRRATDETSHPHPPVHAPGHPHRSGSEPEPSAKSLLHPSHLRTGSSSLPLIDSIVPPSPPYPTSVSVQVRPPSPPSSSAPPTKRDSKEMVRTNHSHHRSAPPAPPKRRKPPAVPVGRTAGGAIITTIASSQTARSSPLSRVL